MQQDPVTDATDLMESFAERTGLRGGGDPRRRYLWTDAFAVRAFVGLHRATGSESWLSDAVTLAGLVHGVLGRHRPDSPRKGWLSGLSEEEGARRPTAGGLRIGKPLRERLADEPLDERLEWDRDGQYFHYLTRWMQALTALAVATHDPAWNLHAADLGRVALRAFAFVPPAGGTPHLHWKMSIDLSRPLVRSVGHHDPLDGFVSLLTARAVHRRLRLDPLARASIAASGLAVDAEIEQLRAMTARGGPWGTTDPLGIGGLLEASATIASLVGEGDASVDALLHTLLADAHRGIDVLASSPFLSRPIEVRLAFRELGLSTGIRSIAGVRSAISAHPQRFGSPASLAALRARLEAMEPLERMAGQIESLWRRSDAQASEIWNSHRDINGVMLAASILERCVRGSPVSSVP